MRDLTGGEARVTVPGATLRQIINNLEAMYPGAKDRLCDDDGINPAVAVVVDGEQTRLGLLQPVGETSEVHFLPAISGGGT